MSWSAWIRTVHRWTSIVFVLAVVASFIALSLEDPIVWVSYTPLPPLLVLAVTGLYMFVLPYTARRRRGVVGAAGGE